MNLLPYDWCAIGYLAITGVLILIFHKNVARWYLYLLVRACVISAILSLTLVQGTLPHPWQFIRDWYPLSTIALFYFEMGKLTQLVFHRFFDDAIIRWEKRVFRGMPCIELSHKFPSLLLSEVLHLCYFSYYLIAVFFGGVALFSGQSGAVSGDCLRRNVNV